MKLIGRLLRSLVKIVNYHRILGKLIDRKRSFSIS